MPKLSVEAYIARMIGTGRGGRRIKPELAGTVAVITGGGSGVGATMGRRFAGVGMAIGALDIDEAAAKQTVAALAEEFGVPTTAVRVDVGDAASVAAAARHVEGRWAQPDDLTAILAHRPTTERDVESTPSRA